VKVELVVIRVKCCPSQQRGGADLRLLSLPWVLMSDRAVLLQLLQAETPYVASMQLSVSLQEPWRGYLRSAVVEK